MIARRKPRGLPGEISRLEGQRRDAAFVRDWGRCNEIDRELRVLRGRLHDAMRPNGRPG